MKNIEMLHLINLQNSMLKYINPKISNHQEEVAYITYRICKKLGYSNKNTLDLIIASLLHDIGSFKMKDMDELTKFNSINTLSHAIYGYLFLNECKNFSHLADIVLYHHHLYNEKNKVIPEIEFKSDASLLLVSDRISVLAATADYDKDNILSTLQNSCEGIFNPKYQDIAIELIENGDLLKKLKTKKYKKELQNILSKSNIPSFDINSQVVVFPLIIDFFSNKIAMHTVKFFAICKFICEYLILEEETANEIMLVTFFHDLGKLCMSKEIWENDYSYNNEIIESQLFYTKNILRDSYIHQDIVDLACINYENLSHYKDNNNIYLESIQSKILVISHTLTELIEKIDDKNEIIDMFIEISTNYNLDSDISCIVVNNYDEILEYIYNQESKYNTIFNNMNEKASDIFEKFEEVWF